MLYCLISHCIVVNGDDDDVVLQEFGPELVMVSAGFDAAAGHLPPLGGYKLSPACFGYMTKQLMLLANGKVIITKTTSSFGFSSVYLSGIFHD